MDVAQVIDLGRESLWVAVMVATPLLGVALGVGLIIGIFQAATSIQEMTLSFIPKLGVMVLALIAFGSWQIAVMVDFFQRIFERIPTLFM
ncbi:flagellar biosynthesis protein FliQ [Porticoccaceae bacterium]|jgi:flagellar biosynthetic protein FliQ|nr:flagellar biosynthesis protein FliQ [Porticoccus sp.]MDA7589742.1 flagellar biosynthesis protein FliQ [Porticoccaceae bacterium]MDC0172651.1 flagellar biosynthesis protein FliQ [Gammaproteobacteria bacterium]MDA8597691.1 flagellar biosynthesis protein FliQ [Porticoccaceae bacterium]MDB2401208.1 flagellar biosynthesis protein FliQ [Porticoccaceae bacterium]|tara:strand:- start:4503 stop:4772 length:270 start_codon:yes stop_codon:yes gene_type:complete